MLQVSFIDRQVLLSLLLSAIDVFNKLVTVLSSVVGCFLTEDHCWLSSVEGFVYRKLIVGDCVIECGRFRLLEDHYWLPCYRVWQVSFTGRSLLVTKLSSVVGFAYRKIIVGYQVIECNRFSIPEVHCLWFPCYRVWQVSLTRRSLLVAVLSSAQVSLTGSSLLVPVLSSMVGFVYQKVIISCRVVECVGFFCLLPCCRSRAWNIF